MLTHTHTYVTLEISEATHTEISEKLKAAAYNHVFGPDGEMDMAGIALVKSAERKQETPKKCVRCGRELSKSDDEICVDCACD